MPLYTYNGALLVGGGGLAATDGLCCGACCKDGECTNKDKCACEEYGGEWHAGKSCDDPDFYCSSSSSSYDSSSSSSRSSYSSYSSYSSDYGACCVAVQGPPTYSSSCSRVVSESNGDTISEDCVTVMIPGAISYSCTTGTAFECYYIGGVFYPGKTCGQIRCGSGSSGSSGSGDSNSSSSSSDKTKPSRTSGWVCKPVWVCEPKTDCEIDNDCEPYCPPDWTPALKYNDDGEIIPGIGGCCPPGSPFDPETRTCAGAGAVGPTLPGKCCDKQCLKTGETCCGPDADGEFVIKKEGDPGCCFKNAVGETATKEECDAFVAAGGAAIWSPCDCPPIPGCPCSKRGEGYTLAYTDNNGAENCCPPGTTVNITNLPGGDVEITCDCQPNDARCQADQNGNWFMSPESGEGWQDCGEVCVPVGEECPP